MESINQKRICSFLTDCVISNSLGFFVFSFFNIESDFKVGNFDLYDINFNYGLTFQFIVIFIYFIIFDLLNRGKTFGRLIFSTNVTTKNSNENLTKSILVKRTIYKTVCIIILPISVLLFFSKNGFTIHDKLAKTTVIE